MEKVLPVLQLVAFGISWGIASQDPDTGLRTLTIAGFVLALPYLGYLFIQGFAGGKLIVGCLFLIGLLIPILNILLIIWVAISKFAQIVTFLTNLPFVLLGILLYVATWYVPPLIVAVLSVVWIPKIVASILAAIAGAFLLRVIVTAAVNEERSAVFVSSILLGFGCYLLLAILGFVLVYDAGASFDGGGHGDASHPH